MDEQTRDYAVGYGKPPVQSRFQKGQSGNPGGQTRRSKTLAALLGDALSQRSGFPNQDGTWMTKAELIFSTLVDAATGTDLKVKRLLFDVLIKLQRANVGCWSDQRLPEITLDDYAGDARKEVAEAIERGAEAMRREYEARTGAAREAAEPASSEKPASLPEP